MTQPLILVDGSAFLFRSYFSTISQNLTNESGFPTGAMFGVVNAIKHLQRKYQGAKKLMMSLLHYQDLLLKVILKQLLQVAIKTFSNLLVEI
jgi:hypothetical protein